MVFKKNNKTLKKTSKKGGSGNKGATLEFKIPSWMNVKVSEGAISRDIAFSGGGVKKFKRTRKNKKGIRPSWKPQSISGGASRKNKKGVRPSWKPLAILGGASRKNKKGVFAPWKNQIMLLNTNSN